MLEKILGHHIVAEFIDIDEKLLTDKDFIVKTLIDGCIKGGAGVLGHSEYQFSNGAVTALILLSESHAALHGWSEYNYAAVDVYSCGNHVNSHVIIDYIHNKLGGNVKIKDFDRGIPLREDTYGLIQGV